MPISAAAAVQAALRVHGRAPVAILGFDDVSGIGRPTALTIGAALQGLVLYEPSATASLYTAALDAEQARFAAGASTPIQVQEAEDALRQARYRVERARVDLIQAEIELKYYTGQLQREYAAVIEAL